MIAQGDRRSATIGKILVSARKLFASHGFAETSVDAIAQSAGIAKGAVYHHFSSKEQILDRLVDVMQGEIAVEVRQASAKGKDSLDGIARGTHRYLTAATAPGTKRILFIDGPAVLGWQRWRAIDHDHFFVPIRGALESQLKGRLAEAEVRAVSLLVAGAMLEAALVCATSDRPVRAARHMTRALIFLIKPLVA